MSGLYIHIPFCLQKCSYCDFLSFSNLQDNQKKYVDALCKEIRILKSNFNRKIETIYIGGGTPSILVYGEVERILNTVFDNFGIDDKCEISIEANPATVDSKRLLEYKQSGINRISFGAQSFDNKLLKIINRAHNSKDITESVNLARDCGIENINIDLMSNLPLQTKDSLINSIKSAINLNIEHISLYDLILNENTALYAKIQNKELTLPDEDEIYDALNDAKQLLKKAGYIKYEISNYAKIGFRCKHNMIYWQQKEFLALGLGASFAYFEGDEYFRGNNHNDFENYYNDIDNNLLPINNKEKINFDNRVFEYLMMGFRIIDGIELNDFYKSFNIDFFEKFGDKYNKLKLDGLIDRSSNRVFLTKRGLELQNKVLLEFL